jgi:hypothetical protein
MFVQGFLASPRPQPSRFRPFAENPDKKRMGFFIVRNLPLFAELSRRAAEEGEFSTIARSAAGHSDTAEAGFCVGTLNCTADCTAGSAEFRDGFRLGQFYRARIRPFTAFEPFVKGLSLASTLTLTGASVAGIKPEDLERFAVIFDPLLILTGGAFVYGAFASLEASRMPRGETHVAYPAEVLRTDGIFSYHRYPGQAALAFGMGVLTSGAIFLNAVSSAHSPLLMFFSGGLYLLSCLMTHSRAVGNEVGMERLHGEEFRRHEAKTPRYLPDPARILKAILNALRGW